MRNIARFTIILMLIAWLAPSALAANHEQMIKQVQQTLQKLGYNPGPIDGIWGNKTAVAVKKYQQKHGLTVTGALDEQTQTALGVRSPQVSVLDQLVTKQPVIRLRSTPKALSKADIVTMIREKGFHHPDDYAAVGLSPRITGTLTHEYERKTLYGDKIVIDHTTGVIWQQRPTAFVPGKNVQLFVEEVNANRYAGLSHWRLPTIEELASLLTAPEQAIDFIDPVFDMPYWYCLSADTVKGEASPSAWGVFFEEGYVIPRNAEDDFDILLVHSGQE